MKARIIHCVFILMLSAQGAWADAIAVDGIRHQGVYIRETETHYYLCSPHDGSVRSEVRSEGRTKDFVRSEDSEQLRQQWLSKQTPRSVPEAVPTTTAESLPNREVKVDATGTPSLVLRGNTKPDPVRENAKLQYVLAERARQAYLQAARQRAREAEQRRREAAAREAYMRDLQLQEQQLRVENLADQNAYLDGLRRPAFGYIIQSPWIQTNRLGRHLHDRVREPDDRTEARGSSRRSRPDASGDVVRGAERTARPFGAPQPEPTEERH